MKTIKLKEENILKAHKEGCSDVKKVIENLVPELFPKQETYKLGDRFYVEGFGGEYILSRIDNRSGALVSLTNGNRLKDPVRITGFFTVTQDEMGEMTEGRSFKRVHKSGS